MRIRNVKTRQGHRLKRSLEVIDRASLEEKKKIQNFLNTSAKFNKLSKKDKNEMKKSKIFYPSKRVLFKFFGKMNRRKKYNLGRLCLNQNAARRKNIKMNLNLNLVKDEEL